MKVSNLADYESLSDCYVSLKTMDHLNFIMHVCSKF